MSALHVHHFIMVREWCGSSIRVRPESMGRLVTLPALPTHAARILRHPQPSPYLAPQPPAIIAPAMNALVSTDPRFAPCDTFSSAVGALRLPNLLPSFRWAPELAAPGCQGPLHTSGSSQPGAARRGATASGATPPAAKVALCLPPEEGQLALPPPFLPRRHRAPLGPVRPSSSR
jgi:hypothetical protein